MEIYFINKFIIHFVCIKDHLQTITHKGVKYRKNVSNHVTLFIFLTIPNQNVTINAKHFPDLVISACRKRYPSATQTTMYQPGKFSV